MSTARRQAQFTVLVYSDDAAVRERIRMAVGTKPAPDLGRVAYLDASTNDEVVSTVDAGGVDLLILDAEAWPAGGMGISRQLKNDDIENCPLICLVLARKVDRWLATWSQADASISHPLDAVEAGSVIADLLRQRAGLLPAVR